MKRVALAAGSAMALMLAACGGSGSTKSGIGTGQTFTYDTSAVVMNDGWDPATEYSDGIIAMSQMYETLTRYYPATHQLRPLLATSWTKSADGLTWTFQLRHGVRFHTGRLMTAAAAKAAILRTATNKSSGCAYIWGAVKTIDITGPYTLLFHLSYPAPLDLQASADYCAYVYDSIAAGPNSNKWQSTQLDAGTGPYQLQTWNRGQEVEVVLKPFPRYWGGWSGAHFSRVVFRVVTQDTTSAQLLRTGQVSFVEQMNPALWKSLQGQAGIRVLADTSWVNLLAQLNAQALTLPVRQAISYGIDYPGLVAALQGAAALAGGLVPPGLPGHFDNLPVYSYDPAKAVTLLHRAGYGPGHKPLNLTLTYTSGDSNEQVVASLIKSSLAKLNINVTAQALAWPTQWGRAKSANRAQHQDIFIEQWWPDYADPYSWFVNLLQTEKQPYFNLSYFSNPLLDKQINQVESLVATNRPAGEQLYRTMQVEALQQAPIATLYDINYQYAMSSGFSGFTVNPAYPNVVFAYNLRPSTG